MNGHQSRNGTSKGVAWVKANFSDQRGEVIIRQAETFLENMSLSMGSGPHEKQPGEVHVNLGLGYQKKEWLASLYYVYLEYRITFSRALFP